MDYFFAGLIILSIAGFFYAVGHYKKARRLKKIRQKWEGVYEDKDMPTSAELLFVLKGDATGTQSYSLDDATWHDLDLDDLFAILNRTSTPIGAQYLYYLLRTPALHCDVLQAREKLINHFLQNHELREKIQLIFESYKNRNMSYLPSLLWERLPEIPSYARFLPLFSAAAVIIPILVAFQFLHISSILIVFIVNMLIHYSVRKKITVFISPFAQLHLLYKIVKKIYLLKDEVLSDIQAEMRDDSMVVLKIAKILSAFQMKGPGEELNEYVQIYFLAESTSFYTALKRIDGQLKNWRRLHENVGKLDALISIACFRHNAAQYCQPVFCDKHEGFSVEGVAHPLIDNAVENSFCFAPRTNIITGSNMSGKTTFLKTIGVNTVLAQTFNMCIAEKYEAPFIRIMSSIGRSDNLITGTSYYLAEVESLLRIINASKSPEIYLFLADEIFRGTNSVERLAASIAVLEYLANDKDFALVATHDLELTTELSSQYKNYHFREQVDEAGLSFDYTLYAGPSKTKNAIALLGYAGYPDELVQNANRRTRGNVK